MSLKYYMKEKMIVPCPRVKYCTRLDQIQLGNTGPCQDYNTDETESAAVIISKLALKLGNAPLKLLSTLRQDRSEIEIGRKRNTWLS